MKKTGVGILIGLIVMISSCHKSTKKVERDFLSKAIERIDTNHNYRSFQSPGNDAFRQLENAIALQTEDDGK